MLRSRLLDQGKLPAQHAFEAPWLYFIQCMPMSLRLLIALLLLPTLSQAAQLSNATANGATYSLSGTVQNSVTGEPIAHALVQLSGGLAVSAFTDTAGRFEFDHLNAGLVALSTRKPGFLDPLEVDPNLPQPIVRVGADVPPVVLTLVPEGIVFGRAQKQDGEPIGFLTVQLFYSHIMDGRKRWDLMNSTQANEDGEFRIAGLKPGRFYLQAGPRAQPTWMGAPGQRAREAAYRPMFYPGVNDLASAAPIDVAAGQQVEADFSLSPEPVFRVSGTIVGLPADEDAGEIWPRVQIVSPATNMTITPVAEQPGNNFRAKVPGGSYIIRADVDTPRGSYRGEIPITVQSDVTGVNLALLPVSPLQVEVSVQSSRPQPSSGRQRGEQVSLRLLSQSMKVPASEYGFTDRTAANTMNAVEPGVYAVEITPIRGDFFVDSAQCGGTDLLRDNLTIGQGSVAPIRISLRDDGGILAGNVMSDGRPAMGTVLIVPDRAPRQIKTVAVGRSGQFQSTKLAPGDYLVLAFDRLDGIEYTNPEVFSSYLTNATHVSVAANAESRVSVNLIRTLK